MDDSGGISATFTFFIFLIKTTYVVVKVFSFVQHPLLTFGALHQIPIERVHFLLLR